jgi:hypothetical protein
MDPTHLLALVLIGGLSAAVAIIAYHILCGQIFLNGLLTSDGSKFSPERIQLLLVTIGLLVTYVQKAVSSGTFPEVSAEMIAIFASSHALYLGGKIARSN